MTCTTCGKPNQNMQPVAPTLNVDQLENGQEALEAERIRLSQPGPEMQQEFPRERIEIVAMDWQAFMTAALNKLISKQSKYGDVWRTLPVSKLRDKFMDEFNELIEALQSEDPTKIADECRDVANMCMMMFIQSGGYSHAMYLDDLEKKKQSAEILFERQEEKGSRF